MTFQVPFLDLSAMHAEAADDLAAAWCDVVAANAFVGGPYVERFEHEWAGYCGTRHAVGVGNGTDALELALRALGIGSGDEVIVPANTFVATAEAVVSAGASPHFVDVDPDTLLLTAESLSAAIGPRTAAVMAVHLYGQTADMDALCATASRAGIAVVEDAAQAHGATWRHRRAGSFGHIGCFSFYPGKNLGAFGDAGAIVTDDDVLAQRVRQLGDHGRSEDSKYAHAAGGVNSRLDGLQAAVLSAKLPRLDGWTRRRQAAAQRYRSGLAGCPVGLVAVAEDASSACHLAVARAPGRDGLREHLARRGVASGIHYPIPCHLQDAFAAYRRDRLPVAERAAREILSLPMFPHLDDRRIEQVCQAVREWAHSHERHQQRNHVEVVS